MTANEQPKLGSVLLAAGGSSRLGRPKQLLKFEGESLLRRAARTLAVSVYFPIVVVLGAESDASAAEVEGLPLYRVVNDIWQDGMSSSIRTGLGKLLEIEPHVDGVLIALCDQPRVTAEMLNEFAARFSSTHAPVIAASYNDVAGVPAFFSRELFDQLQNLEGDKGARDLIRRRSDVLTIDLPAAAFDIDTGSDLSRLG
jgi:molybdenum cofactor cytidylyltransferase